MGSPDSPPTTVNSNITASTPGKVVPYLRLRGITTVPTFISSDIAIIPLSTGKPTKRVELQIRAENITHYILSANGLDVGAVPGLGLTWGFTGMFSRLARFWSTLIVDILGALLGVYATTNGGTKKFNTWVSDWKYTREGQVVN